MSNSEAARSGEATLWGALCRREREAYEELAVIAASVAAPVFRRSGAPSETVEALVQDVLVSVWEYASGGHRAPQDLRAFLYWRARGVWTQWVRRERAREAPLPDALTIDGMEAVDAALRAELNRAFRDCRAALGDKYRRVWEARFEDRSSSQAIADELGIARAQVAVRLYRARKALEECLKKRGMLE